MNSFQLHAISSDGVTQYPIEIKTLDNGKITIRCFCTAGEYFRSCKHVRAVVTGDGTVPFAENEDTVKAATALFSGKKIISDFENITKMEAELARMKNVVKKKWPAKLLSLEGI